MTKKKKRKLKTRKVSDMSLIRQWMTGNAVSSNDDITITGTFESPSVVGLTQPSPTQVSGLLENFPSLNRVFGPMTEAQRDFADYVRSVAGMASTGTFIYILQMGMPFMNQEQMTIIHTLFRLTPERIMGYTATYADKEGAVRLGFEPNTNANWVGRQEIYRRLSPTRTPANAFFMEGRFEPDELTTKQHIPKGFQPGMKLSDYIEEQIKIAAPDQAKWLKVFQKCVLPKEVRETIEEAIVVVLRGNTFSEWGFNEEFEKGLTNSILIYGPPGTGKTMISESIAAVLSKNLMKVDSGSIQSQIPGQAERNIKKNFEKARESNAVLLFDECDSLLYNRDAVGMVLASEINCLLTEIERFDGVVLLTTNRLGRLDPALQRRIVAKIELSLPEAKERKEIWKNLIPKKCPIAEDIDFDWLSSHAIAGGDIKNAILLASRKAISKNVEKITMDLFREAVSSVVKSKKDFERTQPQAVPQFTDFLGDFLKGMPTEAMFKAG